MATIAQLIVDVNANTVNLTKSVDSIQSQLDRVGGMASKVGSMIAGAFATTAIIAAGKQVIDYAGKVTDLSTRLGVSTDAIQEWDATFGQAGVSIDTVAKASAELSNRLVSGDKGAVGALKQMGISLADLKQLSPEAQFNKVADAVGNIQNKSEQIYASKSLFGKGGVELLSALDGKLQENIQSLQDLGIIIDGSTIEAADKFGDQMDLMGKKLLAITASIVGPLLPALSALGDMLMWVGVNVIGPIAEVAVPNMIAAFDLAWIGITEFLGTLIELARKIPFIGKYLDGLGGAQQWLAEQSAKSTQRFKDWQNGVDKSTESTKKSSAAMAGFGKDTEETGKKLAKAAEDLRKWQTEVFLAETGFKNVGEAMTYIDPSAQQAARGIEATARGLTNVSAAVFEIGQSEGPPQFTLNMGLAALSVEELQRKGLMSTATLAALGPEGFRSMKLIADGSVDAKERIDDANASVVKLGDSLMDVLKGVPQMIASALTGGGGLAGAFQAIGSQLGSVLSKSLFESAFNPEKLTKGFASLAGPIGAAIGSLVGPLIGAIAGLFGPSQMEKEGRKAAEGFMQGFASLEDMLQQFSQTRQTLGDDLATANQTAMDWANQLWDAEKRGADAVQEVIDKIRESMDAASAQAALLSDASRLYGPSKADLEATAQRSQQMFDAMLASGLFTQEQLNKAYFKMQQDFAATGDAAAQAWIDAQAGATAATTEAQKAMDALVSKRDELMKSYENEAPEEEMGSIERAAREAVASINQQIEDQQTAIEAQAQAAGDTFEETAGDVESRFRTAAGSITDTLAASARTSASAFYDEFAKLKIPPVVVEVQYRSSGGPGGALYHAGGVVMHAGGLLDDAWASVRRAHSGLAVDEVPIIAQRGEGILSRRDMAALGGNAGFSAFRQGLHAPTGSSSLDGAVQALAREMREMRNDAKASARRQETYGAHLLAGAMRDVLAKAGLA